ncbi:MAG: GYD domain-containing protein [Chloroflexi bacterium]|nr:GYD domain-containing protein [Chloroflexota bacterium]
MPHYIVLANFTDDGVRSMRDLSTQIQAANKRLAAAGIKVQRFFTLGQYDVVSLVEAPNDEAVAAETLVIGSHGHVRTTTLKAFTESEFLKLVERLPKA